MTIRKTASRLILLVVTALVAGQPEQADAQWWGGGYGYGSYYAPSYGWGWGGGLFPYAAQRRAARLQRRIDRLSARQSFYGGYGYGGGYPVYTAGYYGSVCGCGSTSCCGSCGVTTSYYAPSCGCGYDACGCTTCGYAVGECSSCVGGDCASGVTDNRMKPTPTDSVPADPTPVLPRNDANPRTFSNESDVTPRQPSNPSGGNSGGGFEPGGGFGGEFDMPLTPDPTPGGGSADEFEFNRQPLPADDDSAMLPAPRQLRLVHSTMQNVRASRGRTLVRARYGLPQVARHFDIETLPNIDGTQLAHVE